MYRDPDLPMPRVVKTFSDRFPALWLRALDRPEADIRCQAALTIALTHEAGMTGLEVTIPALTRELDRAGQHPTVRLAAARALVALDANRAAPSLLKASVAEGGELRDIAEPALARWGFEPARDEWLKRIAQPPIDRRGLVLAMQGLAATREQKAVPRLRELTLSTDTPPAVRLEAARALGVIRTAGGEADADALAADTTPRGIVARLAAAAVLRHHSGDEAIRRLQALARDPEPTVAAIAVARLMEIDTKLVIPVLKAVLGSPDAPVRAFGVETLFRNPTDEHIRLLGDRLADPHPDVRAQARRALHELAGKREWNAGVLREADRGLASRDWRAREQAALLFGQLDHKPAADHLVKALNDTRGEAAVAAGWALRKLAVPATFAPALEYVRTNTRPGDNPRRRNLPPDALDQQLCQLIQLFGTVRYAPADAVLRPLVPASGPGGGETRAAACWALGYLHEGKATPEVAGPLAGRLAAVNPGDVEDPRVRRMCAVALGRMKAQSGLPTLRRFYVAQQPSLDPVNNSCGWAIEQITGERMPAPKDILIPQRMWFLVSVD